MNHKAKNKIEQNEGVLSTSPATIDKCGADSKDFAESSWQKDIEKHDYYYDDSHGYQVFNPDEEDEDEN